MLIFFLVDETGRWELVTVDARGIQFTMMRIVPAAAAWSVINNGEI